MDNCLKQVTKIFEIIGESYHQIRDIAYSLYSNTNAKKWDSFQNISASPFVIYRGEGEVEELLTRYFCYGSNIYYSDCEYYSMSFSFGWNKSYYVIDSDIVFYSEFQDDAYNQIWKGVEYRVDSIDKVYASLKMAVEELKINMIRTNLLVFHKII